MTTKKVCLIIALCMLMGLWLTAPTDVAHAQFGLETPERDEELPPVTKVQIALGIGSCFVMIIVVKYL